MKVEQTNIEDCFIIVPNVYKDKRGFFKEAYNQSEFEKKTGLQINFIQDNVSESEYGVLRGLHIQKKPYEQSKLVQCLQGKVLDVIVDARLESPTLNQVYTRMLTSENHEQLFVPKGCLHGFVVLSEKALFSYKVDMHYSSDSDTGVCFNDLDLKINWILDEKHLIISDKDANLQTYKEYLSTL